MRCGQRIRRHLGTQRGARTEAVTGTLAISIDVPPSGQLETSGEGTSPIRAQMDEVDTFSDKRSSSRRSVRKLRLAVARSGHSGPDLVHDLVRLVLANLDELVLQVAALGRDQQPA